jgi:large subunit ribosomal protein L43
MEFAKTNPGTVVYLKPRRHRYPCMVAEYCKYIYSITFCLIKKFILHYWFSVNGEREYLSCHEFSRAEIQKWLSYMCTRSGIPVMRFRKYQHTDYPSIQGVWNPFTHQAPEINVAQFPHVYTHYKILITSYLLLPFDQIYFRKFYPSLLIMDPLQLIN